MGAFGSGPVTRFEFDDKTIANIKSWRVIGLSWSHIAIKLGMRSETPLEKFRKENPEIDFETGEKQLNITSRFIGQYIKYVSKQMEEGNQVNPQHVQKILEHFGVFQKEQNSIVNAIQVNNDNAGGLKVNFVNPKELVPQADTFEIKAPDVIDVTKENA